MVLRQDSSRGERGAVAVLFAILAIVLFGFAAIVVDLGQGRMERRTAQSGADASALAGGNALFASSPTTPDYAAAEAAVKNYANSNLGISNWSGCTDSTPLPTPSSTQCISFQVTPTVARVRVVLPTKVVDTTFAKVIGINQINVSAYARATLKIGGASTCGLCVLGSGTTHDIQNGDVTVSGADIHFNGNVDVNANGLVATNGSITVEGTATGPSGSYSPQPSTGQAPIVDPLVDWPDKPDMTGLQVHTNPCSSGPGIYGDRNLRNSSCTLAPGVYVIVGLWDMAGNASTRLQGTGVTLFFTCGSTTNVRPCNAGESGGTLDNSGNGTLAISAPTSGTYAGMAIWFDRNNGATLRLTGNGQAGYTGTVYAASAKLLMNGNGCTNTLDALVIIKDLEFHGNPACMDMTYTQGHNVQIPPNGLHLDQ